MNPANFNRALPLTLREAAQTYWWVSRYWRGHDTQNFQPTMEHTLYLLRRARIHTVRRHPHAFKLLQDTNRQLVQDGELKPAVLEGSNITTAPQYGEAT